MSSLHRSLATSSSLPSPRRCRRRVLAVGLGLLLLEAVLHLFLGNMAISALYDRDPGDGRCVGLKPGAKVEYTGWLWRTPSVRQEVNSQGFRGPEVPPGRDAGVFRVACLGDSFVFGQGNTLFETIPAWLEKELGTHRGKPVQCLNFGVPGYNWEDCAQQLRSFASRWQPDCVLLIAFDDDDLGGSVCERTPGPAISWLARETAIGRFGFLGWYLAVARAENDLAPRQHRLSRCLDSLEQSCHDLNATLGMAVLRPLLPPEAKPSFPDVIRGRAIPLLVMEDTSTKQNLSFPRIPGEYHLTAEGNRQAAEHIAQWMTRSMLSAKEE